MVRMATEIERKENGRVEVKVLVEVAVPISAFFRAVEAKCSLYQPTERVLPTLSWCSSFKTLTISTNQHHHGRLVSVSMRVAKTLDHGPKAGCRAFSG